MSDSYYFTKDPSVSYPKLLVSGTNKGFYNLLTETLCSTFGSLTKLIEVDTGGFVIFLRVFDFCLFR